MLDAATEMSLATQQQWKTFTEWLLPGFERQLPNNPNSPLRPNAAICLVKLTQSAYRTEAI
jgi:hypothetical protein